jgi:hypothetical protein
MSGPGCVPPVVFNYDNWVARYPEFAAVSSGSAQMYFTEATLYCANNLNVVRQVQALTMMLYMLTAHIAQLNSPTTASGASSATPPGRIGSATQGSVSATFVNDYPPGTAQWYQQTKYGAAYWQASLPYRLSHYKPQSTFGAGPASSGGLPWLYPNGSG